MIRAVVSAFGVLLAFPAISDESLAGRASVIDGDTIEIHGTRIRLEGIDAPESRQTCTRKIRER
ncbi:thermonuclease family protein [Xanthobacter autotrophicus]|uniref:thermonuclease family protein n=1 Tax=Xanthobacter autotrophicus TaxID=280 RepID=UPI00372B02F1